jgi:hypothetical protein
MANRPRDTIITVQVKPADTFVFRGRKGTTDKEKQLLIESKAQQGYFSRRLIKASRAMPGFGESGTGDILVLEGQDFPRGDGNI